MDTSVFERPVLFTITSRLNDKDTPGTIVYFPNVNTKHRKIVGMDIRCYTDANNTSVTRELHQWEYDNLFGIQLKRCDEKYQKADVKKYMLKINSMPQTIVYVDLRFSSRHPNKWKVAARIKHSDGHKYSVHNVHANLTMSGVSGGIIDVFVRHGRDESDVFKLTSSELPSDMVAGYIAMKTFH